MRTRVGRLSLQCETDERELGVLHGTVAAVWHGRGLGHRLLARFRRLMGAWGGHVHVSGLAAHHHGAIFADRFTEDLETERAALERKGIKTVARTADLCVMEAPGGQRFFVVAPSRFDTL